MYLMIEIELLESCTGDVRGKPTCICHQRVSDYTFINVS